MKDTLKWLREAAVEEAHLDPDEVLEVRVSLMKKQIQSCEDEIAEALDGIACPNCCDIKAAKALRAGL